MRIRRSESRAECEDLYCVDHAVDHVVELALLVFALLPRGLQVVAE